MMANMVYWIHGCVYMTQHIGGHEQTRSRGYKEYVL